MGTTSKWVRAVLGLGAAVAIALPTAGVVGAQEVQWPEPSGVAGAPALEGQEQCAPPEPGAGPQTATAGDVGIDQAKLDEAIAFAASRMRINIQV